MVKQKSRRKQVLLRIGASLLALAALWLFLQFVLPHWVSKPFSPGYPKQDLSPILAQETPLSEEDYKTLFFQTGLSPTAIDDLRAQGPSGVQQILTTQDGFFDPPGQDVCGPLGITTREHKRRDEAGQLVCAVPFAPLKEGDILVSLSTHTAGWIHGHAGLVLSADPAWPVTLESVVLGSVSSEMNANHWRGYTTFLVLRPKADDETRHRVAELAREQLVGIPYSLVSGVFGDKLQPLDSPHSAHCGYLPWYAWAAVGLDLDGDGGRVVAPIDLAMSENVEVVQIFGLDPADFL